MPSQPKRTFSDSKGGSLDELLSSYSKKAETDLSIRLRKGTAGALVAFSAGTLATADGVEAAIVASPVNNQMATVLGTGSTTLIADLDGNGGQLEFSLSNFGDSASNFQSIVTFGKATKKKAATKKGAKVSTRRGELAFDTGLAVNFASSSQVDDSLFLTKSKVTRLFQRSQSTAAGTTSTGNFPNNSTGYFGFRFTTVSSSGSLFGWGRAKFEYDPGTLPGPTDDRLSLTVFEAYYENSGAGIHVGTRSMVPEPTSAAAWLGLLAMGATGVREMRRRKRTQDGSTSKHDQDD